MPTFDVENEYPEVILVCGIDEAGLGAIAGPVVVASCCFKDRDLPMDLLNSINDSKLLTKNKRESAFEIISIHPDIDCKVAVIKSDIIDKIGLANAWKLGVISATASFARMPQSVAYLIDGIRNVKIGDTTTRSIVKGDQKSYSIAAASIIAKVTRDKIMLQIHEQFPEYGFASHVGYGTNLHIENLKKFGPCEHHRKSYPIVKSALGELDH
jgi:ribonuclease HII